MDATVCEHCGKPVSGEGKRFCSMGCWREYHRASGKRNVCRQCGAVYRPRSGSPKSKFCSKNCFDAHRREHPEEYCTSRRVRVECEGCGREFEKRRNQYLRTGHHYCSRACSNRAHSRALRENPAAWGARGAAVVCRGCGKTFRVSRRRAATARFCSRVCEFTHRFAPPVAEGSPDLRGSRNPHFKGTNNPNTARENARKYLGRKCLICGFDAFVETHHIIARRNRGSNNIENLIVLCPNHHKMAHLGLISGEELRRITLAAIARRSADLPRFDPQPPLGPESGQRS